MRRRRRRTRQRPPPTYPSARARRRATTGAATSPAPPPPRTPSSRCRSRPCRPNLAVASPLPSRLWPALDDASYLLLHEIRLRGVVEITDESSVARLVERGFVARASRGVRITPEGRVDNAAWARLEPGTEAEAGRAARLQRDFFRSTRNCFGCATTGSCSPATGRCSIVRPRSTSASAPIVQACEHRGAALRALPALAPRARSHACTKARTTGSRRRASTRTTRCGCDSTKTCCSRSAPNVRRSRRRDASRRTRVRARDAALGLRDEGTRAHARHHSEPRRVHTRSTSRSRRRSRRSPHDRRTLQRLRRGAHRARRSARSCATWSIESATAARELLAGWPKPQLDGRTPDGLDSRRRARGQSSSTSAAGRGRNRLDNDRAIARPGSRVVIAMPQPMAEALHAPATWADAGGAVAQQGWAAFGHPEWGRFQLGKANPTLSTDALLATLALERDGADATALEASGRRLRQFAAGVPRQLDAGRPVAQFDARDGRRRVGGRHRRARRHGVQRGQHEGFASRRRQRVGRRRSNSSRALPAGAAPVADHPFVVVGETARPAFARSSGSRRRRTRRRCSRRPGFKPRRTIRACARPPSPLPSIGGRSRRKPGRVLVLFDVSDSMRDSAGRSNNNRSKLALAKIALVDALDRLGPDDQIGLRIFTTKLRRGTSPDWKDIVPIGKVDGAAPATRARHPVAAPAAGFAALRRDT